MQTAKHFPSDCIGFEDEQTSLPEVIYEKKKQKPSSRLSHSILSLSVPLHRQGVSICFRILSGRLVRETTQCFLLVYCICLSTLCTSRWDLENRCASFHQRHHSLYSTLVLFNCLYVITTLLFICCFVHAYLLKKACPCYCNVSVLI